LSNTTSQDCVLTDKLKTESVLCVKQTSLEGILDVKQTTQVGFLDFISLQTSLIVLCLRNLTKWRHLCQASLTFFWQTNPTDDVLGVKQTLFDSALVIKKTSPNGLLGIWQVSIDGVKILNYKSVK
jgi:hypothetical protein